MSQMRLGFSVDDVIKNDKKIKSDIDVIQKWIRKQPLPTLLDEQILIFLVAAENDVQTAMMMINGHYHIKQARPDVFAARNLNEDMRRNLRALIACILPVRHNDSVIFFAKLRETSYSDFDLRCALATLTMHSEVAVFNGPPKSATFLIDGSGTTLKHIMKMKPNLLKMITEYIQNCFPIRLETVHILNAGFPTRMLFKMILPFLKPEMAAIIHLHSIGMDMETFYEQWLPKRCLPKEYGGELDSVEVYHRMCIDELESLQWFFDAELLQRTLPT